MPTTTPVHHTRYRDVLFTLLCLIFCLALLPAWTDAEVLYKEDFESGLDGWNIGAPAELLADPDSPGNHFLRHGEGHNGVSGLSLPAEFTVTMRVRIGVWKDGLEIPILLNTQPDGGSVQVYMTAYSGTAVHVGWWGPPNGWNTAGSANSPVALKEGLWVALKIVRAHGCIGVWVDDKPALLVRDPIPKPGGFALRNGSGLADYDDILIATPSEEDLLFPGLRGLPAFDAVCLDQQVSGKVAGRTVKIAHGDLVFPVRPLQVSVTGATAPLSMRVIGPDGKTLYTERLADKSGGLLRFSLPIGNYTLEWEADKSVIARTLVRMRAQSGFETDHPGDSRFFARLKQWVEGDAGSTYVAGHGIDLNAGWIRDHVHEMKAFKWWKPHIKSFVDCMIDFQHPRGFFYEMVLGLGDPHFQWVTPEFKYEDKATGGGFIRLEIEADIEYLMVEGAYHIWQATGDKQELQKRLPALEKGLRYCLNDPTRWDTTHNLMMRPLSIDTWDFVWGIGLDKRCIEPGMPMSIFHGDNSGLYRACLQIAEMREALGLPVGEWRETAAGIRQRANSLLWNGKFYIHQYYLTQRNPGADEASMLSLSNTYNINRGMPTHAMSVKIIDEYQARKSANSSDFAEWYSIDPPYNDFIFKPGEYVNGAIGGFVAGELAKAAFNHGREYYGANILRRLQAIVERQGLVPFFMKRDTGADMGGGPNGWPAAAVLSALMEGLAGITDESVLFRKVKIAPRYPAAEIPYARACLRYGPSEAYVATEYRQDVKTDRIFVRLSGSPSDASFHVLLPQGAVPMSVAVNGKNATFRTVQVEQSTYCDFDVHREIHRETVAAIHYKPPE